MSCRERDEGSRTKDKGKTAFVIRLSSFVVTLVLVAFLANACASASSLQLMANQPRYDPYEPSEFFADGTSSRQPVFDTLTYGQPRMNSLLYTGQVDGEDAETYPFPITTEVMARGQERYTIFCAPCHGGVGDGNGIVAQRGFCCVASLQQERLQGAPPGHLFDVITNGIGTMPSYGFQIPLRDRWAIIAYVRALQLSQNATIDDVPATKRDSLGSATPAP